MKIKITFMLAVLFAPLAHALSFGPIELEKVNWESRQLTAYDINGDKLMDLAYIDGIERSIDLLIQKKTPTLEPSKASEEVPPLKRTRFTRERIPTDAPPNDFIFADFSGTGKVEVAYTSKKLGIVFMERTKDGRWIQTHRISDVETLPFAHVLWAGPLAKGEPTSLVALVKGKMLVIRDYKVVASYGMLYENSAFITLNDIHGDGRLDVFYDYESPRGFAYRLQDAKGRFDREILLNYAQETEKNFGYRGDSVFFFGGSTPFVEERKITPTNLKPSTEFYGCYADAAKGVLINLEGSDDLVLADSTGSELILYHKTGNQWGDPERFPSLKSVTSLVQLEGDSNSTLALFSPDEHAVGLAHWDSKNKRISFPKLLALTDEPVGLFGVAGKAWVVSRNDKEFHIQQIFANGDMGKPLVLEGLSRPPEGFAALNEKGDTLMVLTNSREEANFYLFDSNGEISPIKPPASLVRANFSNLELDHIGHGDLSGDGSEDLMIAERSTLRIFHFSKKHLELLDQVLPFNEEANLRYPFIYGDSLWAYDSRSDSFIRFEKNKDHLWHNVQQVEAPSLDPRSILIAQEGFVVLGKRAFYTLDPSAPGFTLIPFKRWESNLKVDGYNWGSLEYLEGNNKDPYIILFSEAKKILEIVDWGEKPKSDLNFELYKQDIHYNGRTGEEIEPREIIAADLTGRGKKDLIMLIHNKIVIYPQK